MVAEKPERRAPYLAITFVGVCLLWAYWPTLVALGERWTYDPQYSHGYFVPLFALYLLWRRKDKLPATVFHPSWWGAALILVGLALRLLGSYFFFPWLDALSLLPVLLGVAVLVGGRAAFLWSWPAIAFLGFMLPLPHTLQNALAQPLQRVATLSSAYLLETLGFPAVTRGNVIFLREIRVGVVEACNGLSMLVTFFALSAAVVLLRRSWIDRGVVLLCAVPIALGANILRITTTAILQVSVGSEAADALFHDLAGWLMMPLGLALLGLTLFVVKHILVFEHADDRDPVLVSGLKSSHAGVRRSGQPRARGGAMVPPPR
jgi:exosortase